MTKLTEQRAPSPKAIAPHKLMRTWRYKETKHSLKKKAKSVTLNFPLSLCSFTAKDNQQVPASPSSSPIPFSNSPRSGSLTPPSPPSPLSPVSPRTPPPCHLSPSLPPISSPASHTYSAPTSITLPPIPVNSPTHEFYWDQHSGLRSIACRVARPIRMYEDPLAYFKSLSTSDKIRLPVPASPPQAAPLSCYG